MKNRLLPIIAALTLTLAAQAQDAFLANPNQSLVYLNPSFAGSNGLFRNQLSYRTEQPNLSANAVTYVNSADLYLKAIRAGIGITLHHNALENGLLVTQGIRAVYAQHLSFSEGRFTLVPSVQVGRDQRTLDVSSLRFGGSAGTFTWNTPGAMPSPRKSFTDLSAGLLFGYGKNLSIGVAVFHINQPDEGLLGASPLERRYLAHAAYTLRLTEKSLLQIFGRYSVQGTFTRHQLMANAMIAKHFIAGAGIVNADSPLLSLGYRDNVFSVLLSADVSLGKLDESRARSYELHLSYNLRTKDARELSPEFERM